MGEDSPAPSSFGQKMEELLQRLTWLEEAVARQAQRIYALESQRGEQIPPGVRSDQEPASTPIPPQIAPVGSTPPNEGLGWSNVSATARTVSDASTVAPVTSPGAESAKLKPVTNLEERIGGNWLLWVGIVAIVLGTVYFLKLAFENNWVGPSVRVAIGAMFGTGFIYWGEELQKRRYPNYGQTVTGGGNAILYLSVYAAFNFYHLIPAPAAFALMILVTATVSALSARYSSLALALVGLIGGFLTPIWLSTGEDHQVILLSYIALLVAGVAWLARVREWAILNYSSFVLTLLIFLGWALEFYDQEKRGTTQFFLCLFLALFLYIGIQARRHPKASGRSFALAWIAATSVLFYLFSIGNLFKHGAEMFSFILLFDVAVLAASLRIGRSILGWPAFFLNALTLFLWLVVEYPERELAMTLTFVTILFVFYLCWPLWFIFRQRQVTTGPDWVVTTLNGLGYFGALYFLLSSHHYGVLGLLAVSMGVIYFAVARAVWKRVAQEKKLAWIMLGVAIVFVTLAIPIQLHQNWITLSWAVEAVVLAGVAVRTSSLRMHQASWAVMALTILRLFIFDKAVSSESFQLIFNKRFFTFLTVILASYALAWLSQRMPDEMNRTHPVSFRAFILLASLLTVILMTMEATSFYDARRAAFLRSEGLMFYDPGVEFRAMENAKQLVYSVSWAVYSVTLIVVGIVKRFRAIRLFAMGLFAVTIGKVFLVDLNSLERAYRVLSMIALGAILLLAAYLYQRFRKVILE